MSKTLHLISKMNSNYCPKTSTQWLLNNKVKKKLIFQFYCIFFCFIMTSHWVILVGKLCLVIVVYVFDRNYVFCLHIEKQCRKKNADYSSQPQFCLSNSYITLSRFLYFLALVLFPKRWGLAALES